jgi:hypothetical protein
LPVSVQTRLSTPLPEYRDHFDAAAAYLVLNDVEDYRGFAATLAVTLRSGGRMVLSLNSPYGNVIGTNVEDYFQSGTRRPYRGLSDLGIGVHHYRHTLEEYLDAFLGAGLRLTKLADLPGVVSSVFLNRTPSCQRATGFRASCCWHSQSQSRELRDGRGADGPLTSVPERTSPRG